MLKNAHHIGIYCVWFCQLVFYLFNNIFYDFLTRGHNILDWSCIFYIHDHSPVNQLIKLLLSWLYTKNIQIHTQSTLQSVSYSWWLILQPQVTLWCEFDHYACKTPRAWWVSHRARVFTKRTVGSTINYMTQTGKCCVWVKLCILSSIFLLLVNYVPHASVCFCVKASILTGNSFNQVLWTIGRN